MRHRIARVAMLATIAWLGLFDARPTAASICSFANYTHLSSVTPWCSVGMGAVEYSRTYDVFGHLICPGGWPQAKYERQNVVTKGTGDCGRFTIGRPPCAPIFATPTMTTISNVHMWRQDVTNRYAVPAVLGFLCYSWGGNTTVAYRSVRYCTDPLCPPPGCSPPAGSCRQEDEWWNEETCACEIVCPLVMDRAGNGFDLTDSPNGVFFDLNPGGVVERLSWTSAGSDDAFLALDRNGNGRIDDGSELFGSYTSQPPTADGRPNGFLALAVFDDPDAGGNGDGVISAADAVYSSLLFWTDTNHDGRSEPSELERVADTGVLEIDLAYRDSRQRDEHGNLFRYRSRIRAQPGRHGSRAIWDVVLKVFPVSSEEPSVGR